MVIEQLRNMVHLLTWMPWEWFLFWNGAISVATRLVDNQKWLPNPRCEPWFGNIYLHDWLIFGVNVARYSRTMVRIWEYTTRYWSNRHCCADGCPAWTFHPFRTFVFLCYIRTITPVSCKFHEYFNVSDYDSYMIKMLIFYLLQDGYTCAYLKMYYNYIRM